MWKAIDLNKLDKLFFEFREFGHEESGEMFSDFIETTKDNEIPVWDWVDSIGVVTPEDFENDYSKEFVEKNFEELADLWFKGAMSQLDWGTVLECVKDEWKDKELKKKNGA